MTVEIGGRLLVAVLICAVAILIVEWWSFRAGGRR